MSRVKPSFADALIDLVSHPVRPTPSSRTETMQC